MNHHRCKDIEQGMQRTIENRLITTTMKLKRVVIEKKFQKKSSKFLTGNTQLKNSICLH